MWWCSLALAADPPPPAPPAPAPAAPVDPNAEVYAAVDAVYGSHVSETAVCVRRPALAAPVRSPPTVVGVKRGARGCVLLGVMVDHQWYPPEAALTPAVGAAEWAALDPAAREAASRAWVDAVWLAFHQPTPAAPTTRSDPRAHTTAVTRAYLRRDEPTGTVVAASATWTFGADGAATAGPEQVGERETVKLFVRPGRLSGLGTDAVQGALTSKGLVIRQCFSDAWEHDLALSGSVTLEWTVAAGKVGEVAVVGASSDLAKCYARAVRGATWPAEAAGTVEWVFGVSRDPVVTTP